MLKIQEDKSQKKHKKQKNKMEERKKRSQGHTPNFKKLLRTRTKQKPIEIRNMKR